jgi:hypothetical protein
MMAAKAQTMAITVASSGEAARIASRLAWSVSANWSGLVMIQPVTGWVGTTDCWAARAF